MSEDLQKLIDEAVKKALAGDDEAINGIEDRVIRAKAKAALVKAKREQPNTAEENSISVPIEEQSSIENSENIIPKIAKMLEGKFSGCLDGELHSDYIQLKSKKWFEIARFLKEDPDTYFDSLQCNTGFDLGDGMLESRYNLHSMKHLHSIEIRIKVNIDNPDIPSVESIWRVADWFERETYDMFGINFTGHRDLRRILLPEDWDGWPLRKDYEEQETYHGIVVPKVKEGWE